MSGCQPRIGASPWARCGGWTPSPDSSTARMAHLDHRRRGGSERAAPQPPGHTGPQIHPRGAEGWIRVMQRPPGKFSAMQSVTGHKLYRCNSPGRQREGRPLRGDSVCCPGHGLEPLGGAPCQGTGPLVHTGYGSC